MNKLQHIAFIMDGNGRWGKKKNKGRNYGHIKGLETVKKVVSNSINFKIPIITFYVFSSENWKRPRTEINFLFNLIDQYFSKEINSVTKQGIKLNFFGELNQLPSNVKKSIKRCIQLTKKNKKIIVNLAINYGSKKEIFNAFKKTKKKLTFKSFEKNLYTKNMPNPEILIRTGGHQRLSNFMLWQLAYAELFFLEKLWPDFNRKDYQKIIQSYKEIKRNFGSI
jgi:undecaprenyl diphosphate synthase